MLLTKTCNYAIRAALYVAVHKEHEPVPIGEISRDLHISFHLLTKILQKLTQRRITKSSRGPKGGVSLAKSAKAITLLEIIMAVDGEGIFQKCLIGLDQCDGSHPCPLHVSWRAQRERIRSNLANATLAKLAGRMRRNGLRISNRPN